MNTQMNIDIELDLLVAHIIDNVRDIMASSHIDSKKWCRDLLVEFVEKQNLLVKPYQTQLEQLEINLDYANDEINELQEEINELQDNINDLQ